MSEAAPSDWPVGIRTDVPEDVYHRRELGVVSSTALKHIARSPAHYRAWVAGHEKEPTEALHFGRALHMALLEGERFKRTYVVAPDFGDMRSSTNRAKRDEWRAANPRVIELVQSDRDRLLNMIESVMCHPAASRLVAEGQAEVAAYWIDPRTGLRCRLRADWWIRSKRIALDLKSTMDASEDEFAKSCARYQYYKQTALYQLGFLECGEPLDFFASIAVEKEPPYACAVYMFDEDSIAQGYLEVRRDMDRLAQCMREQRFPSYSDGVELLRLPRWKLTG